MARMVAFVNCCGQLDHGDGLALIVGWKGRRSKVAGVVGVRVVVGVGVGVDVGVGGGVGVSVGVGVDVGVGVGVGVGFVVCRQSLHLDARQVLPTAPPAHESPTTPIHACRPMTANPLPPYNPASFSVCSRRHRVGFCSRTPSALPLPRTRLPHPSCFFFSLLPLWSVRCRFVFGQTCSFRCCFGRR